MKSIVKLYSNKQGEIYKFLEKFYNQEKYAIADSSLLEWQQHFDNPIDMVNIIGVFIDNIDNFKINMWICIDEDILINVNKNNANDLIKYLYDRFMH